VKISNLATWVTVLQEPILPSVLSMGSIISNEERGRISQNWRSGIFVRSKSFHITLIVSQLFKKFPLLWVPKFHDRVHKIPLLGHALGQRSTHSHSVSLRSTSIIRFVYFQFPSSCPLIFCSLCSIYYRTKGRQDPVVERTPW